MYPQLAQYMRAKLFDGMVNIKHAESKPSYKVRQGLSLLTGQPVDSTFLPNNIAAAQMVFMKKAAQQQAASGAMSKPKRGTAALGKVGGSHATGDQAAAARSQKGF
jgi:hypothetical protein